MKQFFGMSQRGNLDEALQGLRHPEFIMLFSKQIPLQTVYVLDRHGGDIFQCVGDGGYAVRKSDNPNTVLHDGVQDYHQFFTGVKGESCPAPVGAESFSTPPAPAGADPAAPCPSTSCLLVN